MKGAFLYMLVGKGHYIPAKAIADCFEERGHEAVLADFFEIIHYMVFEELSRKSWRFSLRHPRYERIGSQLFDTRLVFNFVLSRFVKRKDTFYTWYMSTKPDFILCTHYIVSRGVIEIVRALGLSVPVYPYAPDIFYAQRTSISRYYTKYLVPSEEGAQCIISKGQPKESIVVVPFPLQASIAHSPRLSKEEARRNLGLEQLFTLVINLGGEGIGKANLIRHLAKKELPLQIVVLGDMAHTTKHAFEELRIRYPRLRLVTPGFVTNVNEYNYAADIIAGKAGTNTLMEALYMERPCMITALFSAAVAAAKYVKRHQVGWYEANVQRQVAIIVRCIENPMILEHMQERIRNLPLRYNADGIVDVLLEREVTDS